MRYSVGDIITKHSGVFGLQFVKITNKVFDVNRRGVPGFYGYAVDSKGREIRKDDPYGNKIWGFDYGVIKVHEHGL